MSRKNNNEIKKTKDNILEKGLSLFEAKGYNATGIQEIADAAEIPKGSFYNYFSSKEDFGVAVINFYTEKHLLEWTTRINSNSQDNEKLIQVFLDITKDYDCSESQKGCLLGNLAAEISAASILAKVTRDRQMQALDLIYPDFGFAKHKGYPTKAHFEAIAAHGVIHEHRRSYAPVKKALGL